MRIELNTKRQIDIDRDSLSAAQDAFLVAGGIIEDLGTCTLAPRPVRSVSVDPETILVRKRYRPTSRERAALRQMAEAL
ncbi:TPA: hypothetical protein ACRNOL_002307 [Pseudomonas aeruginosa]